MHGGDVSRESDSAQALDLGGTMHCRCFHEKTVLFNAMMAWIKAWASRGGAARRTLQILRNNLGTAAWRWERFGSPARRRR
mmetsp:Transcript_2060/g.4686  ORF Transcript_2060/g.4686 Transcript_2060/m.4686 type:complete len:81 (-) Transcript_2060:3131-3373(-)